MYLPALLTALAGLAVALPSSETSAPNKVKVHSVKLLGSGCPEGTADVTVDATGSLFEATFSEYHVQTGPGTKAADWRANCKLTINMEFDSGYQFSILETSMKGFAEIPKKGQGRCDNTFYFTGERDKINYSLKLHGGHSGPFDLETTTGVSAWSPCGGSTAILNMNTQCNLSPTHLPALIAVSLVKSKPYDFHV